MESDQPPSTSSTNPRRPLHDPPTTQGSRFNERLLDPSAPSQGTPEKFQGNPLPEIGTFSTSMGVHSFSSVMPGTPHTDMHYDPFCLDTPSQLFQSQLLGILPQFPSVEQPPAIYPLPVTGSSLSTRQHGTSLPRGGLGLHPQSQEWIDLTLRDALLFPSTSSGPPPEAATANLHRESVDESGPQVPSLLPK